MGYYWEDFPLNLIEETHQRPEIPTPANPVKPDVKGRVSGTACHAIHVDNGFAGRAQECLSV